MVKIVDVKYPNPKNHDKYVKTYSFYKKLYYTLEKLYLEHSQIDWLCKLKPYLGVLPFNYGEYV